MIPPGEENNPSAWPKSSLGSIVANDVARLQTAEGMAARISEKESDQLAKVVGTAGGAASGLDPLGKGIVGIVLSKLAGFCLKRIPEPIVAAVTVLVVNGAIILAIVHADDIWALLEREIETVVAILQKYRL